jgi:NAD(P)-dependent dehydrogenase (short-subunit alcohol dehydrogenase family)
MVESPADVMSEKWTAEQIPDQTGRTAIVTGANSGLGLETARELARHGASVVLACRDTRKGAAALHDIESSVQSATVELAPLDLASLVSVQSFAESFAGRANGLDLLINNAGVMAPPRRETSDGFELQFGTNVLGHFALTAHMIPLMQGRPGARVVTVSSNAHKMGRINFEDLQSQRLYMRWTAYAQSKLGDLMFALELDRRLRASGSTVRSLAAHPGYAATNLQSAAAPTLDRIAMVFTNLLMAQNAAMGALPTLYAATEPSLQGGEYVGPDGIGEFRGHPRVVSPSRTALDRHKAARLWEAAEELTGTSFQLDATTA